MTQKNLKRTDQEWIDLIEDCRSSDLTVKVWCEQHSITCKAIYYHTQRLRKKGYSIPQRTAAAVQQKKQEIVCLDIPGGLSTAAIPAQAHPYADTQSTAAVYIDFHGIRIEVSNHAAQDTLLNTFHALQELC